MKILFLPVLAALSVLPLAAKTPLQTYEPGSSPNAKVQYKNEGASLRITVQENGVKPALVWCRCHHPFLKPGEKLRCSARVRTENVPDDAELMLVVQAVGNKRKYLNSKSFSLTFPAAKYESEDGYIEYVFTMPDPKKTAKWSQGKELLITLNFRTKKGTLLFRELKTEKVTDPVR